VATSLTKPRLDWRLGTHFEDSLDLLSDRDTKRYRLQRRLIGPVYRPSNVSKYEHAVDAVLHRAVAKLQELDGAEVDLKEWMHMIVVECLGAAVLSWSPGMINYGTDWGTSKHSYLGWRRKSVLGLFPLAVKGELCSKGFGRAFSVLWGLTFQPPSNFKTFFPVRPCCHALSFRRSKKLTGGTRMSRDGQEKWSRPHSEGLWVIT
jgi:hypothetical protein